MKLPLVVSNIVVLAFVKLNFWGGSEVATVKGSAWLWEGPKWDVGENTLPSLCSVLAS